MLDKSMQDYLDFNKYIHYLPLITKWQSKVFIILQLNRSVHHPVSPLPILQEDHMPASEGGVVVSEQHQHISCCGNGSRQRTQWLVHPLQHSKLSQKLPWPDLPPSAPRNWISSVRRLSKGCDIVMETPLNRKAKFRHFWVLYSQTCSALTTNIFQAKQGHRD